MATPIGFDPSIYSNSAATDFALGGTYTYLDGVYRFVQNAGDGTTANGQCAVRASATAWIVTYSKGASAINTSKNAVGVFPGAFLINKFCFVLIDGLHTAVKDSSNGVTAGRQVTPNTTANGDVANVSNAYDQSVGTAITSGSGGLCSVQVKVS